MSKIRLENVRLTFPNLFEAQQVNGQGTAKFSAAFLFGAEHPATAVVKKALTEVAKEKWGAKAAEVYKGLKAADRLCLHDGASKTQYEGYEGNLFVNSTNELRPTVLDGNRNPLVAADGKPYSGCYVNAVIEVWAQDNKFGKRLNASLLGVQFHADGERLAGGSVASEDDFEEIPDAGGDGAADVFGDEADSGSAEEDPFE